MGLLADVRDVILVDIAPEPLCIVRSIVGLTSWVIVPLTGKIFGFAINIPTEICMVLAVVAAIALEVIVLVSHATDVWAGVMIDIVIDVVPGIGVDVLARLDSSMCASLEPIPMVPSSSEALILEALSCCCTTAAWNCRSLQARIPSCHV